MSGTTTVIGGTVPIQFTPMSPEVLGGLSAALGGLTMPIVSVNAGDAGTVPGAIALAGPGLNATVNSASLVIDPFGDSSITLKINEATLFAGLRDTIAAGSNGNKIYGSDYDSTRVNVIGDRNEVHGGDGLLFSSVSGSHNIVITGAGSGAVKVTAGDNDNLLVAGRDGLAIFDLSQSTGAETIASNPLGNSGKMFVTLGAGADTVIAGSGDSTVRGGTGPDVFAVVAGHAGGTLTIYDFKSSDTIVFDGYNYSAKNLPSETVASGSDVITLVDGTKITLVGYDHTLWKH